MKIGYVPYSNDLSHPADRRRLGFWAESTHSKLEIEYPLNSDLLVLSNAANFAIWLDRAKQPIVLDLVDAYFGENPNLIRDFLRNGLRSATGTSSLRWMRYTAHLNYAIRKSNKVVVASKEQAEIISDIGGIPFIIPDNHSELIHEEIVPKKNNRQVRLLWEGYGYTFKHFKAVAENLDEVLTKNDWYLDLVTTPFFPRWGGKFGEIDLSKMVTSFFPKSYTNVQVIPWSIPNLIDTSRNASLALIPIDTTDKFGYLKSENKLLSMWTLGLPTFVSNTPSYSRVIRDSGVNSQYLVNQKWSKVFSAIKESKFDFLEDRKIIQRYIDLNHSPKKIEYLWSSLIKGF